MEKNQKGPIIGFCHVYAINNWKSIVNEQFTKLKESGLYNRMDRIFVGLIGTDEDIKVFDIYDKADLIYCINKPDLYEALTLSFLHGICKTFKGYVFYIHTKGVTRKYQCFTDWRRMMEHFIIERYELCISELWACDVVGVNWHLGEGYMNAHSSKAEGIKVTPHFSGNFWWATTKYIRTLPLLYPLESKYQCEFWIGKNKPLIAELWNSGIHHHRNRYSSDRYKDRQMIRYYKEDLPL